MRKTRPLLRHRLVLRAALVTSLVLVAPVRAQDRAKIEVVPMLGHTSSVRSVAFSPDGARVLSGSDDKPVKLWDAATGTLIRTVWAHSRWVHPVAISPDCARALSGSDDGTVRDYKDTYYAALAQLRIEQLKKQHESVSPPAPSPLAGAPRNPFGVEDVGDPYGEDVRQFARSIQLPGGSGDRNAAQWSPSVTTGKPGTLDGDWFGRWEFGSAGTGRIQVVGNRLYVLYTDQAGRMTGKTWILEAVIESRDRLIGRWMQVGRPSDTGPFVGVIVGDDRIDGIWNWGGTGRWDFRRKLKR